VETRTPYILVGCGDSGKGILDRVRDVVARDLVSVFVNSQSLNMEELDSLIRNTDMVFLLCGLQDPGEVIAAGVISELCKSHRVPVIGVALMPAAGAFMVHSKENLATLRGYIGNLIVLDHSSIVQSHPEVAPDYALDLTHQLIGKLINETTDLIDTISLFNLEDVWSYRD
jgi:cell division GTPase FtsZ